MEEEGKGRVAGKNLCVFYRKERGLKPEKGNYSIHSVREGKEGTESHLFRQIEESDLSWGIQDCAKKKESSVGPRLPREGKRKGGGGRRLRCSRSEKREVDVQVNF